MEMPRRRAFTSTSPRHRLAAYFWVPAGPVLNSDELGTRISDPAGTWVVPPCGPVLNSDELGKRSFPESTAPPPCGPVPNSEVAGILAGCSF